MAKETNTGSPQASNSRIEVGNGPFLPLLDDLIADRAAPPTPMSTDIPEDLAPWSDAAEEFVTCLIQGYSIKSATRGSGLDAERATALLRHPRVEQGAMALLAAVRYVAPPVVATGSVVLFPAGK